MPPTNPPQSEKRRSSALSRWENEGGAGAVERDFVAGAVPELTNTELVQLRIRVIALENVLIAVLAEGSDRQIEVAREMAEFIMPRPGFTDHPLTIQAANHMTGLLNRAVHFRSLDD